MLVPVASSADECHLLDVDGKSGGTDLAQGLHPRLPPRQRMPAPHIRPGLPTVRAPVSHWKKPGAPNSLERRLPDFRRPTPPRRSVSRPDAPRMAGQRRTRPRELRRRPARHVDRRGTSPHRRRSRHADRPQLSASQCGDPAPRIRRDLVPDQRWPEKPRLRSHGDHQRVHRPGTPRTTGLIWLRPLAWPTRLTDVRFCRCGSAPIYRPLALNRLAAEMFEINRSTFLTIS